jgi:hypothetical protein
MLTDTTPVALSAARNWTLAGELWSKFCTASGTWLLPEFEKTAPKIKIRITGKMSDMNRPSGFRMYPFANAGKYAATRRRFMPNPP